MIHTSEHRVTSLAKDRIEGFHREAEARQLARQSQASRTRFRLASPVARLVRLPFALAVQLVEHPLRNAVSNGAVRFFGLISRMTGATRKASS